MKLDSEKVIEIDSLSKKFKEITAVNNLRINVFKGDVFGFLGPNGAGKSTTIRMLLSLIAPTNGKIKIFGMPLKENRLNILRNVGAIVESADFYNFLSGYKNLEIIGRISGKEVSSRRIMEVLELVGLHKRYKSKVKTYSHGMKQRLGIAQALLHNPDLIILDEPTTGLDPQGMKEIRDLIIHLSKDEKKTIFLSSHILYEVELVANRMTIINKGSTVIEGEVKDLLNAAELKVTFEVDDPVKAAGVIRDQFWNSGLVSVIDNRLIFNLKPDDVAHLNKYFIENGVNVRAVIPKRSLEEYFLNLTESAG